MDKVKSWFIGLVNGVLQNIIASYIVILLVPIAGFIYALYSSQQEVVLLLILIILVLINIFISISFLRQWRGIVQAVSASQEVVPSQISPASQTSNRDPRLQQLYDEFEIANKYFDDTSTPQKLVTEFINRGNNVIYVKKITFAPNTLGIPEAAISSSYRKTDKGRYIIPFDSGTAEVKPEQSLCIKVELEQIWKPENVNSVSGRWGYFRIYVLHKDSHLEGFYSI